MKYILLIALAALILSCNRKMNLQQSKMVVDSTYKHKFDSSVQVNTTLSQSYESLLQSTSNSDVIFETSPCPDGKIGGAGMPRIINKVTIDSKGNKVYEGQIKSFRESASVMERKYYTITQSYDSLAMAKGELEKSYSLLEEKKNKVVKVTAFPLWLIIGAIVAALLWINERFNIVKIPFLTKTRKPVNA